jgi:hypothetical protein
MPVFTIPAPLQVFCAPECFLYVPSSEEAATLHQNELQKSLSLYKSIHFETMAAVLCQPLVTVDSNNKLRNFLGCSPDSPLYFKRPNALVYFILRECTFVRPREAVEAYLHDLNHRSDQKYKEEKLYTLGRYIDWSSLSDDVIKTLLKQLSEYSNLPITSVVIHAVLLQPMNREDAPHFYLPNIIVAYIGSLKMDLAMLHLFLNIHGYIPLSPEAALQDTVHQAASYFAINKPNGEIAMDAMAWQKKQLPSTRNDFVIECRFSDDIALYISSNYSSVVLSNGLKSELQICAPIALPMLFEELREKKLSIHSMRFIRDGGVGGKFIDFSMNDYYDSDPEAQIDLAQGSNSTPFHCNSAEMAYKFVPRIKKKNVGLKDANLYPEYQYYSLSTLLRIRFQNKSWSNILVHLLNEKKNMTKRIGDTKILSLLFLSNLRKETVRALDASPPDANNG